MKKRIFSLLLCLVMVIGLLPTVALANEEGGGSTVAVVNAEGSTIGTYGDFQTALSAAEEGQTITLLNNVDVNCGTTGLKIDKAVTINLNGKTIIATGTGNASTRKLNVTAPITIQNGTLRDLWINTNKDITIVDVDITIVDDSKKHQYATTNALCLNGANTTATLTDCNLSLTTTRGSATATLCTFWTGKNVTVNMTGGSLSMDKQGNSGYALGAIYSTADGLELNLNSVDINYTREKDTYSAINVKSTNGEINIMGGTITANSPDGTAPRTAIDVPFNTNMVINIKENTTSEVPTINGKIVVQKLGAAIPTLNIESGVFTNEALFVEKDESDISKSLIVTGGEFAASDANKAALEKAGTTFQQSEGKLIGIANNTSAKVGEVFYEDFNAAITAAKASESKEITLFNELSTDLETVRGLVIKTEGAKAKLIVDVGNPYKSEIANVFGAVTLENVSKMSIKNNNEIIAEFGNITVRNGNVISGAISEGAMEKDGYYYHPVCFSIAEDSGYFVNDHASALGKYNIVVCGNNKYPVAIKKNFNGIDYLRVYEQLSYAVNAAASNDDAEAQINDHIILLCDLADIPNYYTDTHGTYYRSDVQAQYEFATFTLDLNGHSWISNKSSATELVYMLAVTANNTNVTVKNGTITGTNAVYIITTNGMFEDTNLELEDLTINAPNGHGMYLPASGNVTMKNVTINAGEMGIQTCAANVTMEDCVINVNGSDRRADKEGDGLVPDGAAISVVQRPGYKSIPSVEINSGAYSAKNAPAIMAYKWESNESATWNAENKPVIISGGIFSSDPSAYCVAGKIGIANLDAATRQQCPFRVGDVQPDDNKKVEAVGAGETKTQENTDSVILTGVSEEELEDVKDAANAIVDSVHEAKIEGNGLTAAANDFANKNVVTKADANKQLGAESNANVKLMVQHYMDIELKEIKLENDDKKTITFEITPMAQLVATTAGTFEAINLEDGESKNAVKIGEPKKLDIYGEVTVRLPLPRDVFAAGEDINIKHVHGDGKTYIYTAKVKEDDATGPLYVEFVNPNGFSSFTLGVEPAKASIGNVGYESLQDAVNDVKDGQTINLTEDGRAVVGRTVSFTVDGVGNATIDAGSNTIVTRNGNAFTCVYTAPVYTGGTVAPTYSIETAKTENGSIAVSPKSASKGKTVTISVTPDKGYELDTLTALDKDGKEIKLTEKNGKYTFEMPASKVTVKATFKKIAVVNPFMDVKNGDYFYGAVLWAVGKGVTSGTSATTFSPNEPCTRAQIVTFLWRAAGSPEAKNAATFSDVSADAYYAKAVAWAVEQGITNGTSDTTFSPDEVCSRAQAVTFLSRALKGTATVGSTFADVDANSYYAEAVAWAVANDITMGTSTTTFSPDEVCTRGQIVTLLFRAMAE